MTNPNSFEHLLQQSEGNPFVFDNDDMRTLHFDEKYIQSAMSISAPDKLLLSYTRAMMGFLLFQAAPKHILLVGLGGGSLVKYCYRYLPSTRITVLELHAEVIALRDKFMIPADDQRLRIIHSDAAAYMQVQQENIADVIMLDGFSSDGPAQELSSSDFYADCLRSLTPQGVLVSNLWDRPTSLVPAVAQTLLDTDWRIWWCRTDDSHNYIAFFVKGNDASIFRPVVFNRAQKLDQRFDLRLSELVPSFRLVNHLLKET
ncbi:transferase spermidine synthase [Collimonas sp.]|jgi:spermidine synthase|uniref:spermine/spermidine synthase domain-containing protein n=1 Tax=Collimonas sp. TaxID=1963772 RepID=UPI002BEE300C|nr:transferase spermidine synthase [Collimonas sp.]HWW05618.1 transferase spermidine synthase [Collimonas sp.]